MCPKNSQNNRKISKLMPKKLLKPEKNESRKCRNITENSDGLKCEMFYICIWYQTVSGVSIEL